jgi:hypothetical protein
MFTMAKKFYTVQEAVAILGLSAEEVMNLAASGKLQRFRDRDAIMFKCEAVDQLASGKSPPARSPVRMLNYLIRFSVALTPTLGPRGRELRCFIPDELPWVQLNYGQGEGQVMINNCQWGFYWQSPNELAICLESGEVDRKFAYQFVLAVAKKLSKPPTTFELTESEWL